MNTSSSLSENETVVEFFSSHLVRAAKKKKVFRRRALLLLFTAPKILIVAYFGFDELMTWRETTAAIVDVGARISAAVIP
jgi:hypothetical protein